MNTNRDPRPGEHDHVDDTVSEATQRNHSNSRQEFSIHRSDPCGRSQKHDRRQGQYRHAERIARREVFDKASQWRNYSRFFVAADDCPSGDEDQNKVRRHAEYFNVRHNRHMEYS